MIHLDEANSSCYGLGVQRKALQPVTNIPVLIPCEDGKTTDGKAWFDLDEDHLFAHLHGRDDSLRPLRIVRADELKNLRTSLSSGEARFLADCLALKHAHNSKDQLALQGPYERLFPFLVGKELWEWAGKVDADSGFPADEQRRMQETFGRVLDRQDRSWTIPILLPIVGHALRDVRLVLWWFQNVFTPAIFCPDLKTAIFVKGLLGEIRCCPRCEKLFVPRNSNVDYCSPAHRDAHRVARWRAQRETKRITAKKKNRRKKR